MKNFIILDIETGSFEVESGIFEVAALAIEDGNIIDKIHLGIIEDENLINDGYGSGYQEISTNNEIINQFKLFINKYNYPIVAHNAHFDRKFLVYYKWLDEDYEFYDSIRAIKYENPNLFSYALNYLLKYYNLDKQQSHTAFGDVEDLYNLIKIIEPKKWIPAGGKSRRSSSKIDTKELQEQFEVISDLFSNKNIVFTGKGPYKRDELSQIAIKCGANVLNSVTKKTDILVVGEGAGSKLAKANDIGIEILNIDDFMDMTQGIEVEQRTNVNVDTLKDDNSVDKIFDGLTISLIPMRVKMSEKVGAIIEKLGGNPISTFRKKETNILVYEDYGSDFVTVHKAKDNGIKTIPLHEFNKIIISGENITF